MQRQYPSVPQQCVAGSNTVAIRLAVSARPVAGPRCRKWHAPSCVQVWSRPMLHRAPRVRAMAWRRA